MMSMPKRGVRSNVAREALKTAGLSDGMAAMIVAGANRMFKRRPKKQKPAKKRGPGPGLSGGKSAAHFRQFELEQDKADQYGSDFRGSLVALKFVLATVDPFSAGALQASIPTKVMGPSYKVRSFLRTTMTVGSAGNGMVLVCPTLVNDQPAVCVSNATTFAQTSFNTAATAPTGAGWINQTGLPFNTTELTDSTSSSNVSGRIVSVGLRVTYTGTEANKGGVYSLLAFPDRSSIHGLGPATTPAIGNYAIANVRAIDRLPIEDSVFGMNPNEVAYSNENEEDMSRIIYPFSNGAAYNTTIPCPLGLWVSGAASGSTFEVEVITHAEYVGKGALNFVTPSMTDSTNYERIIAALMELEYSKAGLPNGRNIDEKLDIVITNIRKQAVAAPYKSLLVRRDNYVRTQSRRRREQSHLRDGLYSEVRGGPFI